jgi:aminomethyltransferase
LYLFSSFSLCYSFAPLQKLEKTALYDLHVQWGGKMVPFAGYSLPVQYPDGVLKSHLHTRLENSSSLFDVGHMGQIKWYGKDRVKFIESLLVADVAEMSKYESKLSLITSEKGTILDDTVISNHGDYIYMVVNGATKYNDMKHFDALLASFKAKGNDVSYEYLHTQNLVAIQGLGAVNALKPLLSSADQEVVAKLPFMSGKPMTVMGVPNCIVTRCGYTGEDGFEVSVPESAAVKIATALASGPGVLPAALGARDSLRLEAGLCLYGHDMDDTITPGEATLVWTIGKRRRAEGNFLGSQIVLDQIKNKSWKKKRVGFLVTGAPAREGAKVFSSVDPSSAKEIGVITSGTFSPSLKAPIAMGYIQTGLDKVDTQVAVEVRGKLQPAVVSKMPFVPHRYFKPT